MALAGAGGCAARGSLRTGSLRTEYLLLPRRQGHCLPAREEIVTSNTSAWQRGLSERALDAFYFPSNYAASQ